MKALQAEVMDTNGGTSVHRFDSSVHILSSSPSILQLICAEYYMSTLGFYHVLCTKLLCRFSDV